MLLRNGEGGERVVVVATGGEEARLVAAALGLGERRRGLRELLPRAGEVVVGVRELRLPVSLLLRVAGKEAQSCPRRGRRSGPLPR